MAARTPVVIGPDGLLQQLQVGGTQPKLILGNDGLIRQFQAGDTRLVLVLGADGLLQQLQAGDSIGGDPYFANVVLLAGFEVPEAANGATSFTEFRGHSFSKTGTNSSAISTAQAAAGKQGLFIASGANYDRFTTTNSAEWSFKTGSANVVDTPFTIEGHYYCTSHDANLGDYLMAYGVLSSTGWSVYFAPNRALTINFGPSQAFIKSVGPGISLVAGLENSWRHWYVAYDLVNLYFGLDGICGSRPTPSIAWYPPTGTPTLALASNSNSIRRAVGYHDEIRITKGVCRPEYVDSGSHAYTVPPLPFPRN